LPSRLANGDQVQERQFALPAHADAGAGIGHGAGFGDNVDAAAVGQYRVHDGPEPRHLPAGGGNGPVEQGQQALFPSFKGGDGAFPSSVSEHVHFVRAVDGNVLHSVHLAEGFQRPQAQHLVQDVGDDLLVAAGRFGQPFGPGRLPDGGDLFPGVVLHPAAHGVVGVKQAADVEVLRRGPANVVYQSFDDVPLGHGLCVHLAYTLRQKVY